MLKKSFFIQRLNNKRGKLYAKKEKMDRQV